jgi:agmatinase
VLLSDIPNNAMIRGAAGLEIVGGDVVEVAPQYDATTNTAHAGAQMLFEIFAVVALARTAAAKHASRPRKGARGR